MRNSVLLSLGFLILLAVLNDATEKVSRDPISKAFQLLNEEEKTDFLSYFLALGLKDWAESQARYPKFSPKGSLIKSLNISAEKVEKFEKMNIPKDSRKKLFEWTKNEFNLTTKNVLELIRTKKCSGATCLPDIGELCCPW